MWKTHITLFEAYSKVTIIKTVWYLQNNRHISQYIRIKMSEIDPDKYNELIFDKGTKMEQWMGKDNLLFNKGTGIIGDMHIF